MLKNSITGFVDPKHKYHKLVGIKSDTEFKKKWALNNFKYILLLNATDIHKLKIKKYNNTTRLFNLNKKNILIENSKLCKNKSNFSIKNKYNDIYFLKIFLIGFVQKKISSFFKKLRSLIYSLIN